MNRKGAKVSTRGAKMRAGYGMVEIMLGIVIVAVLIGGAYVAFQKIYMPAQADKETKKITLVIAGAERVKSYNGGAYPDDAGAITTIPKLMNALGGAKGTRDVGTWTYSCPNGGDSTVSFTTTAYDSPEKQAIIIDKINDQMSPWTAQASGQAITFQKTNASCQPAI